MVTSAPAPGAAGPRLRMRGVTKRFGAAMALCAVDLEVGAGEVHALLGENGAGKSTLMKILAGAICADAGEIRLDGHAFRPRTPLEARRAGVAMIYQELNLAPHLTVVENMLLGAERHTCGILHAHDAREQAAAALARLGRADLPLDAVVARLSAAERQLVEIGRALRSAARVLVMDEPTSSLGAAEIEQLFRVIERLRGDGVSVIYISHFLEEVRRVADRYTVLRDGRHVASGPIAASTPAQLIEQMIGRRLEEAYPRVAHAPGAALLDLRGLSGFRTPTAVDLTLHRGEILGLAGLLGAGRTELLRCVFGLDPVRTGTIRIGTHAGRIATHAGGERRASPARRLRQGVGLLSEDRKSEGLAQMRSLADNLLLSRLGPFSTLGVLNARAMNAVARDWMRRLDIRAQHPRQPVSALSGGNQQKVALARLLHHDVDVFLLDEPTRGIDVGSKAQIYELIGELAAAGKGVLLVSSALPELLGVCDRIGVLHRGRLVAVRPAREWTEHELAVASADGFPPARE